MIYTVTFNPSLDYIVSMDRFELGKTNRTTKEQMLAGGKGINVSTVLHNLGIENVALGFVAGFTGQELKRMAAEQGLCVDFIELSQGATRINVKMKDYDGTEINGMGPEISDEAVEQLKHQLLLNFHYHYKICILNLMMQVYFQQFVEYLHQYPYF